MRLGSGPGRPPQAEHIAGAVLAATQQLGHRPALTVRSGDDRQEQGFASLAGWIAKGSHLLRDEYGLGPGAELGLVSPACWPAAAVALAAWWAGITVVLDPSPGAPGPGTPGLVVAHTALAGTAHSPGPDREVLWFGDAVDGTGDLLPSGEFWTEAVLPFPDRAPRPDSAPHRTALRSGDLERTEIELLEAMQAQDGVLGLRRDDTTTRLDGHTLSLLALRPFITGAATVIVDVDIAGVEDEPASALGRLIAAERITTWG
jgi:hypothetical protein